MREHLVDLYVRTYDLSEEARDHGLGAVEVTEGENWFREFTDQVASAIGSVMTEEEQRAAWRRLF